MKIKMTLTLPYDNEIQFFDCCKGAAAVLTELAQKAIDDGDCDQFLNTQHAVHAENDDGEEVGRIEVVRK